MYACNREHPADTALNYFGNRISFGELFAQIDRAARAFLALGVRPGDVVPIVSVSTVASVVCFYALNRIGAVVDFLNVLAERDDLVKYLQEAEARVVVTLDLFGEKVVSAARAVGAAHVVSVCVSYAMPLPTRAGYYLKAGRKKAPWQADPIVTDWRDFLKLGAGQPAVDYVKDPHTTCLLAHTGGTTGVPKAVMLSDCAMNTAALTYLQMMKNAERRDVFLQIMIPFVVYGILSCTHVPLCLGFCAVLIPKFDPAQWKHYLRKYRPNHIMAVPAYVSPLLKTETSDLSFIKNIAVGGDGMTMALEEEMNRLLRTKNSGAVLTKGYAMTEVCATAVASFTTVNKVGSVGIPLPKNNLMIYDNDTQTELPGGQVGEICLQSPSRMLGYRGDPEATKDLFRVHADGSEWLHTGDLGYVDEDGFVYLQGRMKRVILTVKDGVAYKVFPNMSEKVLDGHEAVLQSCIVGAVSGTDQVLRAYVAVAKADMARTPEIERDLRERCEQSLPSYARPTFYTFREALPLTPAGKVDYRALETEAQNA